MVPDESRPPYRYRLFHTVSGRLAPTVDTLPSPRLHERRVLVPIVVFALAVGVAVVPAVGTAAGLSPGVDGGSVAGIAACDGFGGATAGERAVSTAASLPVPSGPGNTVARTSTNAAGAVLQSPASQGPVESIVAIVESLPGESLVVLGAYSRYGDGDPLEHPIRSEIDSLARRLPGVQFGTVVDELDASESTIRYHTRVLEREEQVQTATVWGTQRLFPATTDPDHFESLAAVRDDARSSVLRAIDGNDPATVSAIADSIDRAPSTVSHHLSALESADLVVRERVGQSVHVSLASGVDELLAVEAESEGVGIDSTALELVGD